MSEAKNKDRAKAIDELANDLEKMIDDAFNPQVLDAE